MQNRRAGIARLVKNVGRNSTNITLCENAIISKVSITGMMRADCQLSKEKGNHKHCVINTMRLNTSQICAISLQVPLLTGGYIITKLLLQYIVVLLDVKVLSHNWRKIVIIALIFLSFATSCALLRRSPRSSSLLAVGNGNAPLNDSNIFGGQNVKRIKTMIAAATMIAASGTLATTANAQDGDPFTGLYGGIEGGFDWTKLANDAKRDRSLYYGGVLGYRAQMDSGLVLGLEGTFGKSGYDNNALGIEANYEWSGSLILGTTLGDGNNLLYGKAGFARSNFDPVGTPNDSFNDDGWRFGLGYERALSSNMSLRLGGDYTTYGNDVEQWQTKAGLLFSF